MVKVIPRVGRSIRAICLAALVGLALLLVVTAYYPFQWDPPRVVHNDVTRTADGALRFGEMNQARTPGTPDWLADARRSGIVQIELEIKPQASQEQSPASFMMLARDFWHTDFALGQDHSELLVWLRRPGSDGTATQRSTSLALSARGSGTASTCCCVATASGSTSTARVG